MAFDSDEYFTKRQRLASSFKMDEINARKAEKLKSLSEGIARDRIETLAAREESANSFTNRLGLDADSFAGRTVNLAANAYSGLSRTGGDIAVIAPTAATFANESGMTESDFQAYNRYVTGEATPQDMALLNSATEVSNVKGLKNATRLQMFKQAGEARKSAINIDESFDASDVIDQRFKNALQKDLGDGFDSAWNTTKAGWDKLKNGTVQKGMDDLLTGSGTLVTNAVKAAFNHKQGSAEYVFENLPQLAIGGIRKGGAALLLGSNAGYASDYYQKGIEKYQSENGGKYPPEAMRKQMAQDASLAGAMEQISDKVMLGAGKLTKAAKIGENTGRVGKTLGATGAGVANESITEGIQTYLEGEASLTPASAKDIYTGAAIGGITGGAMTGGMRAMSEFGQAMSERPAKKVAVEDTPEYRETFKKAVEENNVDVFLDKTAKTYNPETAVGVLLQAAKVETATPEVKTANFTKATEIIEGLEQDLDVLANGNPEEVSTTKDKISFVDQKLSEVDPADKQQINALKVMKQGFEKDLQEFLGDPKVTGPKIAALEESLNVARRIQNELGTLANPVTPETLQTLVDSVKSRDKGVASTAADTLINLSMTAPNSIDNKVLLAMAYDKSNGLSKVQRTELRKIADVRQAENSLMNMKKVSQEIYTGNSGKRQLGIKNYREMIGNALAAGNEKATVRPLALMAKFVDSHTAKAAMTATAVLRPGISQVVRVKDTNEWIIRDPALKPLNPQQMVENGGFTVDPDDGASVGAVKNIGKEAKILADSYAQLSGAVKAKFSSTKTKAPVLSINVLEEEQGLSRPESSSGEKVSQPQPNPTQVVSTTSKPSAVPANDIKEGKDITFAHAYGTKTKPQNMQMVPAPENAGRINTSKTGQRNLPAMLMHAKVLLVDGTVVSVNPTGGAIMDGNRNEIDVGIVVAFKNDIEGAGWIKVQQSTSQPSGSSVADAPSATVVPSTTQVVKVEATEQPAVVSKANPAPVAEVATPKVDNSPKETSSVLPSTDTKAEEVKAFQSASKRVKVEVTVYNDGKYVTVKLPANEALEDTSKDINALEDLLKCMKGS